jgi:hypothetical protein
MSYPRAYIDDYLELYTCISLFENRFVKNINEKIIELKKIANENIERLGNEQMQLSNIEDFYFIQFLYYTLVHTLNLKDWIGLPFYYKDIEEFNKIGKSKVKEKLLNTFSRRFENRHNFEYVKFITLSIINNYDDFLYNYLDRVTYLSVLYYMEKVHYNYKKNYFQDELIETFGKSLSITITNEYLEYDKDLKNKLLKYINYEDLREKKFLHL